MLTVVFKIIKNIFPFLYYSIGYIIEEKRKDVVKIKGCYLWIIGIIFLVLESTIFHFVNLGNAIPLVPNGYGSWNVIILSSIVICIIIKYSDKYSGSSVITLISSSTLITYLVSEIFDNILFSILGKTLPIPMVWMMPWIFVVAVASFVIGIAGTKIVRWVHYVMIDRFLLSQK